MYRYISYYFCMRRLICALQSLMSVHLSVMEDQWKRFDLETQETTSLAMERI